MDMKNINYLSIIGVIGAVLLVVGVFLNWATLDLGIATASFTGMDFFNNVDGIYSGTQYTYVPIVALVLGILSIVGMIVTFFDIEPLAKYNKYIGLVVFVLSIVSLVLLVLFYTQSFSTTLLGHTVSKAFNEIYSIDIGFWLTLAGSVITVLGGLMPLVQSKLKH